MDEVMELFENITKKCDECDELTKISDVAETLKRTLQLLEKESKVFKRLLKNNKKDYVIAQMEFITSFLASLYVNNVAKSQEEAMQLMEELASGNCSKTKNVKKTDA